MKRAKPAILVLLGALLLASLMWLVYVSIEFYEETEKSQWSIEALRNPYLAAQNFLRASGIEVIEADSLAQLETMKGLGTMLITQASQVSQPRQLDTVLSWLAKGGSLIVAANDFSTEDDLLLTEFGVDVDFPRVEHDDDAEDRPSVSESLREYNEKIEKGMTAEEIAEAASKKKPLTEIDFEGEIGVVKVEFSENRILQHGYIDGKDDAGLRQPFSWSSSEHGVHMIQFEVGKGLLTIVSDPGIWQSRRIGDYDHAYLLWILSSGKGNFALLRSIQRESLWSLAYNNAYEFLLALAILTLMSLWYLGHRFGRVVPMSNSNNRALSEHFSATAGYLWHRRAAAELLKPMRHEIFRRAHIAIPAFARAGADTRLELIARRCNLDQQTVRTLLQSDKMNEATFVSTVKLLRQIEQSL